MNDTRKMTVRSCYCHLGGKLGNQLFSQLIKLGWFEKLSDKATVYQVTDKGYKELKKLGLDLNNK